MRNAETVLGIIHERDVQPKALTLTCKHWKAGYSERRKPGLGRGGQKSAFSNSLVAYST